MQVNTILRSIFATALAVAASSSILVGAQTTRPCVSMQIKANGNVDASNPIQDGAVATAIVKLDEACANDPPTQVEISGPGLQCGRSTFNIVKGDRSTYEQQVTCRTTSGSAPTNNGLVVDIPLTITYKGGPRAADAHTIKRKVVSSGSCSGSGDPHLQTLDGVRYDFQKPGVFRLFQSNNFQVQIFQEKCGPVERGDAAPSCYQGVAVAFGASVARFMIVDGKIQVGKGSPSLQWLSVEKIGNANADGYRIFTNVDQATYVDVNLDRWAYFNNYPFLNVALQVSPYFKNSGVDGLMGNWNGNAADDVTNNDQLAASHGVSITDNLFTCVNDACTPMLKASSLDDSNALALPSSQALSHQGYVALGSDAIQLRSFAPTLKAKQLRQLRTRAANTTKPVADVKARATQLCKQVINSISTRCGKYVRDTDEFITTVCLADAVTLGDLSVVDGAKLSYLRECRRELDARLTSKTACAAETNKLKSDRAALLFGDLSRCNKQCSGRGKCLPAGCKCNAGYTGHGCDITI